MVVALCQIPQIEMPPPKKPKNGPTTVEQFLSKEELQILGKHKRPLKKEGIVSSRAFKGPNESQSLRTLAGPSHSEFSTRLPPAPGSRASSYPGAYESASPEQSGQNSSAERQEVVLPDSGSERILRDVSSDVLPRREYPGDPPRLVCASSLSPSDQDSESNSYPGYGQSYVGSREGRLLERLFASRPTERIMANSGSSFHDPSPWPHILGPGAIGQPPILTANPRHSGVGYRLSTSETLASLMTRPAWIPYDQQRPQGNPGQSRLHLNLRPSGSFDIQGYKPTVSFSGGQQHQQQQHLDGRPILASLPGKQMSSGSADPLPPHGDDVFLLKTSSPSRAESCTTSYLGSPIRQPQTQLASDACGIAASGVTSSTNRTESAPVYLHPAFQLPPSTTSSIRKNHSTSATPLMSSPPPTNTYLPGLPRHSNARSFPPQTSPLKQSQGQNQAIFRGSSFSNNFSGSNNAGSIKNSSSTTSDKSRDTRDDIHLLDLSLKNRQGAEFPICPWKSTLVSPPRKSSLLIAKMEESLSETDQKSPRYTGSDVAGESDESMDYINVTSPLTNATFRSHGSETRGPTILEKALIPVSAKLAGLLTKNIEAPVPISASLVVKNEDGAPPALAYTLQPCKTDARQRESNAASREPSDCKSPKEEGPLVSPSSCMQVLPLGSSGESSAGSAHLQAATSTTPEAGPGSHPHFLLNVRGGGIGISPPHMKHEIVAALPGSSIQAKLCQVCNDNASGFHYGVWSCEGCKAFFKRSIQGPVDYICPATNTCTIDKHRRKSCQACRLRRCYEVGMNKGSQRKERKSSGNTGGIKGKRCRADSSESAINSTNNGASSFKAAKRSRSASILEALQKADLPVLESYHNHSLPATRVHLLNTLIKLADRELVYLINWAKHVPGYTCLTLSDQVHLIECCWMELLLLNCAFRSMEYEGRTLVFAPDFHLERQQWALTGMGDVLEQVSAVSEQMVLYGLNKEELLLLQATVLVNAEVRHLDSFMKIQDMRQVILDVFMEVAGHHRGYGNLRHAPSILLLLTHIRQAGERGITYFQRLKMEGCVTFCDLLTEMLDSHNASGERRRLQQQQQQQPIHHLQQPSQPLHQQQPAHHQQQHPQHSMAPE